MVVSAVTGRWGLKDRSGRTVLPCEYWSIGPVNDNYITANNEKGYAVFNKDGDIVVPFGEFEYIGYRISESMVDVRKNGLIGYISLPEYVEQPESWAQSEVERAIAVGLVPEDMRKDYRDDISRADFCRLAINLIEIKTGMKADVFMNTRGMSKRVSAPITFTDTTEPVILAAGRLGIVNGVGNNRFNPTGTITRQDAAVMLQRTAKVLDFTEPPGDPKVFSDSGNFSDYAVEAIDFVSTAADKETGNSVMAGTGNDNFSPFSPYTRQQAYITVLRLFLAV
nr:S-layer homology domain-containing protein [Phosphitispora fastidiosa]